MVASVAEPVEVVVFIEGAGDAWAVFMDESRDEGVVMIAGLDIRGDNARGRRSYRELSSKCEIVSCRWTLDIKL